MTARVGIVTFPGSLDDRDAARAVARADGEAVPLWHADRGLRGVDAVVLPGGFSYGDYLRCGAIARFSAVMESIVKASEKGQIKVKQVIDNTAKDVEIQLLLQPGQSPEIAIDASHLPGDLHGDPADRLIVATARHLGAAIVTRDSRIIAYAGSGHVRVVPC